MGWGAKNSPFSVTKTSCQGSRYLAMWGFLPNDQGMYTRKRCTIENMSCDLSHDVWKRNIPHITNFPCCMSPKTGTLNCIYIYKLHILLITSNYYIIHAYYIYIYIKLRVFFNLKISPSQFVSRLLAPLGTHWRQLKGPARWSCPNDPRFALEKAVFFWGVTFQK